MKLIASTTVHEVMENNEGIRERTVESTLCDNFSPPNIASLSSPESLEIYAGLGRLFDEFGVNETFKLRLVGIPTFATSSMSTYRDSDFRDKVDYLASTLKKIQTIIVDSDSNEIEYVDKERINNICGISLAAIKLK